MDALERALRQLVEIVRLKERLPAGRFVASSGPGCHGETLAASPTSPNSNATDTINRIARVMALILLLPTGRLPADDSLLRSTLPAHA
jgi:hypothetical protein